MEDDTTKIRAGREAAIERQRVRANEVANRIGGTVDAVRSSHPALGSRQIGFRISLDVDTADVLADEISDEEFVAVRVPREWAYAIAGELEMIAGRKADDIKPSYIAALLTTSERIREAARPAWRADD